MKPLHIFILLREFKSTEQDLQGSSLISPGSVSFLESLPTVSCTIRELVQPSSIHSLITDAPAPTLAAFATVNRDE